MPWLAVLVALGLAKGVAGWIVGADLQPDTALYTQGGFGLFPSPLGRALGSLGVDAIAGVNVAANALLVLGSMRLARSLGRNELAAGAIALLSPLGVWTIVASMDGIAAALLVWAAYMLASGRVWVSAGLAMVAAGFHTAALVIVALALLVWLPRLGFVVAVGGALLALGTQYATVVGDPRPVAFVTSAAATAALFLVSFLPVVRRLGYAWPAIAGGAVSAGLVASSAFQVDGRYMLPAVAIGAACVGPRRGSLPGSTTVEPDTACGATEFRGSPLGAPLDRLCALEASAGFSREQGGVLVSVLSDGALAGSNVRAYSASGVPVGDVGPVPLSFVSHVDKCNETRRDVKGRSC